MTAAAPQTTGRFLRRTSERSFDVVDNGIVKGRVWRSATVTDDSRRWRASDPSGNGEWSPWCFYATPQAAAIACVREYDLTA